MYQDIIIIDVPLESANGSQIIITDSRITANHVVLESIYLSDMGKVVQAL